MADSAFNINPLRVSPCSVQEYAATGCNTKFKFLSSDLAIATLTGTTDTATVNLGALPANWYIDKGLVNISTAFAGAGGLTVGVGPTTSAVALIAATTVLTKAVLPQVSTVPIMTNLKATATANLQAVFTCSVSGSLSALTAGELDIYANIQDVARLP